MDSKEQYQQHSKSLEGFKHAVVHLAVLTPSNSTAENFSKRLAFASIWLLAPGRQPPPRPINPFLKKFKEGTIEIDRITLEAEEAIQWYRSASHEMKTPAPIHDKLERDGTPLYAGQLGYFPRWPVLGVPIEGEDPAAQRENSSMPFRNQGIIRYSRRISNSQVWPNFLDVNGQTEEPEEAFRFLEHHMHVDFREYPEYLGGMTLAVPDRDVHSIRQFVDPKKDGSESLYFHLKPHQGQTLRDLRVTTLEGQEGMLTSVETYDIPEDGLVEINRPSAIHISGLTLTHKERGVLIQTPMRSFMRQMNLTTEVIEERHKISVQERDGKKSPPHNYVTEKKTVASSQTYGEPIDNTDAYRRLIDAKSERTLNNSAKIYDQTWFMSGQRQEALVHIINKIKNARSSLFIADPYFNANQINQFLFAVELDNIKIKVLTSFQAFNKNADQETDSEPEEPLQDFRVLFEKTLGAFHRAHNNDLEIKVVKSKSSLFHDRFIAVDGRVWMLGSSLNSIGTRPTLVMRVPHGEIILTHLMSLYDLSVTLDDFLEPADEADA
ncbi:hypothetical protein JTA33_00025 [Pseudomonas sp. 20GA0080]|uniref:VPA1262 family N-terminal domain-containing protein n=1 Tax=Pseudomonas alliivorans TaxID=2810613 RepID=UPI001AEAF433|nr:VPA1262 family N-terminal domain-containing protein [Pseudomonas alliivorans]MBP0948837.1 hypothetical protein [Pseudomonas alliivorans]